MSTSAPWPLRGGGEPPATGRAGIVSTGLWVFMAVAAALFSLFLVAYVMRMSEPDAIAIALPWRLWPGTVLLAAGSVALHQAAMAGRAAGTPAEISLMLRWLWVGGACTLAFLGVQWGAWQQLLAAQVRLAGHPAGSFFYLLTTMHGLHVLGGLVGWAWAMQAVRREGGAAAWRVALCARYGLFMLAVWLALFAALAAITPEVARVICGTAAGGLP